MLRHLINTGLKVPKTSPLLATNCLNAQQVRTTFVLKRRTKVPLAKKNQKPTKLRGRHFNYELVEDSNNKKYPNLDVILTSYVQGVGRKGEVVNVPPTFAYNKLLLPGLATYVTPANVEKYANEAIEIPEEEKHSSQFAQRTVNVLKRKTFAIVMNKDHPWVVEPWHIRASMRKAGCYVLNDSAIELPKQKITGPDLTKEAKVFRVTVTINNTEKVKVRCQIHHWSTDPIERLPYVYQFYKIKAEPLFADEMKKQEQPAPADE